MIMLAAAARVAAPGVAPRFERDSRNFHAALSKDRAAALAAADALKESARAVASELSRGVTRAQVFEIIDSIAGNAISPRFTDYSGSVQAVMAVDTLLTSLGAGAPDSIRADINGAYRAVRDPNAYDPREFRSSLGRAAAAIRKLK
jgi:predicted 2-oxoglutarate/Fe(II)-dependent dioxygenase YbiX